MTAQHPQPRVLTNTADAAGAHGPGAVWKLAETVRDLDANLIALPPGERIDAHDGPDLDVLIHVVAGSGQLETEGGALDLGPGTLAWLPRRSRRAFAAGSDGLRYLTVHRRRQALTLKPPTTRAGRTHSTGDRDPSTIDRGQSSVDRDLPYADRDSEHLQGPWLLARLGRRVLRPGGAELTRRLLAHVDPAGKDVVELAPGLGRTATEIMSLRPRSYVGIDADGAAAARVVDAVRGRGEVRTADASATGLPDACADVVIGEAMLTMQGDRAKHAIIAEATRLLRPGGRYAVHELALTPDDLAEQVKTDVRRALARSLHVNARPLTPTEWTSLLADHGLVVEQVDTTPLALLEPRRLVADEGLLGAARFARNVLAQPKARRRVRDMSRTIRTHRSHLRAVAIVATVPG